ncbi:beta-galactosidase [Streptomyces europaeiscabiei]|uniref:beta-galactosidase n=1 Tax=Streptomyces europaeiscabiei TaxID=146819 RepID=UPI0029A28A06|nr:beta-galactosidase [Streptomyces europaeiscabiei]MDX2759460.1 beta-galactosidase [Streptomyces europaeiscabiei]MDX3710700.1 beta-galactosidase [Streptomyces europaeiscabiei]
MRVKWKSLALAAALSVMPLTSTGAAAAPAAAEALARAPHTVTYDQYAVQVDGKPLYLWGAELHYFRLPSPDAWRDVLQKIKAGGFNAVSLYFDWGYHSAKPGQYDFTGIRDVERLLDEAERAGLYVIARPGPYINAEVSGGGMPAWRKTQAGVNRTSEPEYMEAAREWMSRINPIIARHQLTRGEGTVILYQVENEYQGGRRDADYMQTLIDWARQDGIDVPTFVNDGGANNNWVSGKGAPDIYGFDAYPQGFDCKDPGTWKNLPDYSYVNEWKPESPLIIPEAQGGAFDPWGGTGYQDCAKLTGTDFTRVFSKMNIAAGVSGQSFYMTYGGTNWGWLADPNAVYTSYDYGAPINESRQLTEKYQEFKRLGYMVNSVTSLARTDKAEAPTPSDEALRVDRRINPDDDTQFFTVRHADTRVKDKDETTLSLTGADGDYPRVPQQGTITVDGRDAKLLVAGYDLSESQRLVYSTSEIMTHVRIADRDVALLYGREGEAGETVLRYAERPEVTVPDGEVTTTWDAERGDLRLNYIHKGLTRVLVNGMELLIADTAETAHWWQQDTAKGPVLVRGPSLVRTAELARGTLKLTGDSIKATKIEVIADAKKVTWNGRKVAVTQAPRPVGLPALTTWKYKEEAPESAPGFDDSTWTTADRLTAHNPELAGSLPVLAMDEYGYHHGNVWYRGRFRTTGKATGLALNANTGPTGQYAVWLNGRYLGSSGDGAHTFDIPADMLKAGEDNVLSVLVENAGHNEEWGHDYSKEPRGLLGAEVVGGASTLTWKIQGSRGGEDPVDTARGPYNNGGLYGERAGWSLAGYPDGSWKNTTLAGQSAKTGTGVRWYRTSARLDLPQGQDNAIALDLAEAEGGGTGYRAQIFVNGWLIGRYLPDTGPQTRFVIPKGILREQGGNTIALAVWSTKAGAGPGSAKLVDLGATAGGIKIGTVTAPSYDAKTYAMPDAGARVTVDAEPFLSTGTAAEVPVSVTVPKDAPTARNVELTLKVPDGWTATTDDTTRFARVRPGDTVTADYTVTPPTDPVHYAVLSATAKLTQPGRPGTVTGVRAVQVPPPGLSADADVSDLTLVKAVNGWGPVEKDTSNGENAAGDGRPLSIGGTTYAKGLGVHANSQVRVYLGGGCTRFTATAGVDDEVGDNGSVSFEVIADGRSLFDSPVRYGSDGGTAVDVDVTGARWLDLLVDGDGDVSTDHADWADAKLTCSGGA